MQISSLILTDLLDEVSDLITIKDNNFKYIFANKSFCDYLSKSLNNIIGSSDYSLFPTEEADNMREIEKEVFASQVPYTYEHKYTTSKGHLWFVVSVIPFVEKNTNFNGLKIISRNVDDIINSYSDEILKDSQLSLINNILDSLDIMTISIDEWFKVTSFNKVMADFASESWGKEFSIGEQIFSFLGDHIDGMKFRAILNDAFNGNNTVFIEEDPSGKLLEFRISGIKKNFFTVGASIVITDISERLRAQDQINLLNYSVSQNPSSIVITDLNGNIEFVNNSFELITGYSFEEVLGKNPRVLKSGFHNEKFYKDLWETVLNGETWKGEFVNKKKNGKLYWESASISPIYNSRNELYKLLAIKEDITEKKNMEEQQVKLIEELFLIRDMNEENIVKQNGLIIELTTIKEELEKSNNEKDKFFSIIAHDLRNPFVALLNSSELLEIYFNNMDDNEKLQLIKSIKNSAKNTYSLLENLLQWARSQMGAMQFHPIQTNISRLLSKTSMILKSQAEQKKIEIKIEAAENIIAFIDSDMISTVLRNLISNAIKFSNKDSCILIKVITEENQDEITISIKDSGIGIPKEILDNLFTITGKVSRKGTNNEAGTGLGLLLCKEFVELNKGRIWIESEENVGTTFYFTLPVNEE